MSQTMDAWRQRTEAPLMIAALLFLAAYTWQVLDPNMSATWRQVCDVVLWSTWAMFATDYVARFALAESRGRFFVRHLHDLAVVLLPVLRPLRLLRVIALLGVLNQVAGRSLRGRVVIYTVGSSILILFLAALAILDVEGGQLGSEITTFGDALWWALVTATTVGYGDMAPVTTAGRLVAAGLMLAGIALLGAVTATLASWLLSRINEEQQDTRSEVVELAREVRELRSALGQRASELQPARGE